MKRESSQVLAASISKLVRRDAVAQLSKIIGRTHAADLAYTVYLLPVEQREAFFAHIEANDLDLAAQTLSEVEEGLAIELIKGMEDERLVALLERSASDDTADLLELVASRSRRDRLVAMMGREGQEETESLLAFDPESAGGLMSTEVFALEQSTTAAQALERLRGEAGQAETVFYLYVVNEHGGLVGVASLRELVRVNAEMAVEEFMLSDVVRVRVDADQEEVARLIARYNFLALPVVDANNRLVGVVTVDDIIDVIRSEATEDMLLMAGAGHNDLGRYSSPTFSLRARLPWLLPSLLGGVLAMFVLWTYEAALEAFVPLAALIPVIVGLSGNIGTQSATIVARGVSLGRSGFVAMGRVLGQETLVGMLLGAIYGGLVALMAGLVFRNHEALVEVGVAGFVATAGLAVLASMTMAATLGGLMPLLFGRLGFDPAKATGPVVIAAIDVFAVWIYMVIAGMMLVY